DEPLFAQNTADIETDLSPTSDRELNPQSLSQNDDTQASPGQEHDQLSGTFQPQVGSDAWEREQRQGHEKNVAAIFGRDENEDAIHEGPQQTAALSHDRSDGVLTGPAEGTLEEEEI